MVTTIALNCFAMSAGQVQGLELWTPSISVNGSLPCRKPLSIFLVFEPVSSLGCSGPERLILARQRHFLLGQLFLTLKLNILLPVDFRPQHGMYEDMEPQVANPVLPFLAVALADNFFQDYRTFEEIEAFLLPADGSLHHLRIKKIMLRVSLFQIASADGPTEKNHGATLFSSRTLDLGHRAGYEENIGIYGNGIKVFFHASHSVNSFKLNGGVLTNPVKCNRKQWNLSSVCVR